MTDGTSQGLFIVVAIVIFGIFTLMTYILFEDTLSPALASMFTTTIENTNIRADMATYKGKNLYKSGRDVRDHTNRLVSFEWGPEYTQHGDVAPIFNRFGEGTYTISFDLYTEVPGEVHVYTQNGNTWRHHLSKVITVNSGWDRYSVVVDVTNTDPKSIHYHEYMTLLSFYGTYGSGRKLTVKDVKVELGATKGIPEYEDSPSSLVYE